MGNNILLFILAFGIYSSALQSQGFTLANQEAGISYAINQQGFMGGGTGFFDFNNDGQLDIYVVGGKDVDKLYRNDGNGAFTEVSDSAGLYLMDNPYTFGMIAGDINNDGFSDIFLTTFKHNEEDYLMPNYLLKNNGDGTFSDITFSSGIFQDSSWSTSATFLDFNLDGFLDIYVANYVFETDFLRDSITNQIIGFDHNCYHNYFFVNNGDETFTEMAQYYGIDDAGCGLAVAATDYDNDHDIDIMVANDFGEWGIPDRLFRNDFPADGFTDVSASSGADVGLYGMGIAVGDYNEDGNLDYYVSNLGSNALLQSIGDGTFIEFAAASGTQNTFQEGLFATSWGTAFFDYDNDTDADLFVCNGHIPAAGFIQTVQHDPNKLYKNNGDGTFTDVAEDYGVANLNVGRGFSVGDYNDDGAMDLLVGILDVDYVQPVEVSLYKNEIGNGNNWLKVYLEGTTSNRDAYGAHVILHADGRQFIRELDGGSSHASMNETVAHFGLGSISYVDSIVVYWPGGMREVICFPSMNENLHLVQGDSESSCGVTSVHAAFAEMIDLSIAPNPVHAITMISYSIPKNSIVSLNIYDVLGNHISTLFSGMQSIGEHSYNLIPKDINLNFAGIYLVKLEYEGEIITKRFVFLP